MNFEYNLSTLHDEQPEDWEDKEYIPDPEDKKPEVITFSFFPFLHSLILHYINCLKCIGKLTASVLITIGL